jgi:hypothetical protein
MKIKGLNMYENSLVTLRRGGKEEMVNKTATALRRHVKNAAFAYLA